MYVLADVVMDMLAETMVNGDILYDGVIIIVVVAAVLALELSVSVSYSRDMLTNVWGGLVMNVDISIEVRIGLLVEALARVIIGAVFDIDVDFLTDMDVIASSAVITTVEFIVLKTPSEALLLLR